jgi:large subunit ribosomal protein L17
MKHRIAGRRLDRTTEHRTAMLRNLVTSLFRHERIKTTTPKAKELKRFADKFITLAKKGGAHHRRIANRDVRDVEVLNKLFGPVADRFRTRPGGYTRIVRVGRRAGDSAEMAIIELVDRAPGGQVSGEVAKPEAKEAKVAKATGAEKPARAEKARAAEKAPKAEKKAQPEKKAQREKKPKKKGE